MKFGVWGLGVRVPRAQCLSLQQGVRAARSLASCFSSASDYCGIVLSVACDAAKAAVRDPLTYHASAIKFIQFTHSLTRRFHSSEFLDALSVLPKDAERQRRKAKHMAKSAA